MKANDIFIIIGSYNYIGTVLNESTPKNETVRRTNYFLQLTSSKINMGIRRIIVLDINIETNWLCRVL